MKKQRLLLAALILSVSGWVSASVPIIKLHESRRVEVNFYSLLALNSIFFGIKDHLKPAASGADPDMHDPHDTPASRAGSRVSSTTLNNAENAAILTGQQVREGSFSSYASEALASASISPAYDAGLGTEERRRGLMVALAPTPKIWVVLLLVLGCVIYQGRRRQRQFGFEKNRLNAGIVDA